MSQAPQTVISNIQNHVQTVIKSNVFKDTFCPIFTNILCNITLDTSNNLPIYLRFSVNPNNIEIIEKQCTEYTITITQSELEKIVTNIGDDVIDSSELLEMWKVLFTQITVQVFNNPIISNSKIFKSSSYLNKCIQVNLIDSNKVVVVSHTLTYMDNKWNIESSTASPNIERVWNMTSKDCMEYQRAIVNLIRSNTNTGWYNIGGKIAWLKFITMYISMRQRISTPPPNQAKITS